jgi:hypothetical protein
MRNVMIGVPVLMTNCQVSLNRNIGSRMPVKEGGSGETQGEGRRLMRISLNPQLGVRIHRTTHTPDAPEVGLRFDLYNATADVHDHALGGASSAALDVADQ